jgi:hypothetical protein
MEKLQSFLASQVIGGHFIFEVNQPIKVAPYTQRAVNFANKLLAPYGLKVGDILTQEAYDRLKD